MASTTTHVMQNAVGRHAVLTTEDGVRAEFLVTGMNFRPMIDHLDITDFSGPPRFDHVYRGMEITIEGRADGRPQKEMTDAEALAWAVIRGDEQAALVLSDEVQMAYQQPESFVPRQQLIEVLKAWFYAYQNMQPGSAEARLAYELTEDVLDKLNLR